MTDAKKDSPAIIRNAATIILAREKNRGLEVYLLRRSTKSGFMGGLYVFPGGVVDPEDTDMDSWSPHLDLSPDQIEKQLGGPDFSADTALGFGVAAIRETLEEAGVLIARDVGKTAKDFAGIASYRLNKDLPGSWFRTRMMEENWTLSFSSLGRWSHWITPRLMEKRFDTRFFVVFMPKGQTCVPDNMETKHGVWLPPLKALEHNLDSQIPMSPPTIVTLTQLADHRNIDELKQTIETRPWGDSIMPRAVISPKGPIILEPWDPLYNSEEDKIDPAGIASGIEDKVLSPGEPFSRIWCDNGVWKSVGI